MDDYEKIEQRKIIPVAAMISAGKSKLLNVLYNIDFLECTPGIGTKFVNILRYNPEIKEPCFYHLKVVKEGENYIFYKKMKVAEGAKKIIEENKNVNEELRAQLETKYEDIFYMTEINEIPFIKDKDFLLTHDLCDIPGLNEYQKQKNIKNEKEKKENEVEDKKNNESKEVNQINNKKDEIEEKIKEEAKKMGLVVKPKSGEKEEEEKSKEKKENNFEDEINSKIDIEKENTYLTEIFKIIKNQIDGAIIILSIENYYKKENYVIIAKLQKVLQKEISNFLIILNKMDLSLNPKDDIQKCKGLLIQHFQNFKAFNINLNTFIPLSVEQLQNELLMDKSYKHLIYYHFYNYMSKINEERFQYHTVTGKTFIDHLADIIKTVGGIKKEDIESKVEELNQRKNIADINKEIIETINEIKTKFIANDISLGISPDDFNDDTDDLLPEPDELFNETNGKDFNDLNPTYIMKYFYICHEDKENNALKPSFSKETINLLGYFSSKKVQLKLEDNQKVVEKTKINREIISHLNDISNKFKDSKFYIKEIENIINEIKKITEDLKTYDVILIPFIGSSNAGKTTIINGIIGKEILPTDLNECTRRGIIIRYAIEDEDDITIRKASFEEEKFLDKTSYYFQAGNLIGKGIVNVRQTLQGLNLDFNKSEKDSFYYIRTKIKLFDDLGLSKQYKKMIYLIDLPGYGTGNIFETKIYKKIMSICNAFIFVVRNSVIKENDTKKILDSMFNQIKEQKNKLSNRFIKSCLFVLNNDNKQSTGENDIEIAKNDIKEVIRGIDKENINVTFFNAKYYSNYCYNFNYFYNIENLFKMEHNMFTTYQSNIFKYPELFNSRKYNTFGDFIYKELNDKIKSEQIGNAKIPKNQKISDNVHNEIEKINKNYFYLNEKDYQKYGKFIEKVISYGQENINQLKTLKESNIEIFKKEFSKQIHYINEEVQEDISEKIDEVISILDLFFLDREEIDSKQEEVFKTTIQENIYKLTELKESSNKFLDTRSNSLKKSISDSLEKKRDNIEELLKSKSYNDILKEINNEVFNSLKQLNTNIDDYLANFKKNSNIIIKDISKLIGGFSKNKIIGENIKLKDFNCYLDKKLGNDGKDLSKELYEDIINSAESLRIILSIKGPISYLKSLFSNYHYLSNIINIIIDTYLERINSILSLLKNAFNDYISDTIHFLILKKQAFFKRFNHDQLKRWKELDSFCQQKKKEINKVKMDIWK